MKQKDIGLLISICILAFLAVFSDKKMEVMPGYFVTHAELELGGEIFRGNCRKCHGRKSRSGAPPIGSSKAWKGRLHRGMEAFVDHALDCAGRHAPAAGGAPLTRREAEAAVAYIVRESR